MSAPIATVAARLEAGQTTAVELTEAALTRVEAHAELNAWLAIDADGARAAARESDARRARGEARGPLDGLPIGIKDNIVTRGVPTTCGSRILAGWTPPYDATVVARLDAAGAVVLGKLNLDAFGMGSSTENSAFGPTRNPWDVERAPGGSSGGCAAAVAAGDVVGALGTDTGGSIRQPAAFCGVVGLKPTYGRCSRFGLVAFASSLDVPGPLARSVRGVAALLQATAGHDPRDATSADREVPVYDPGPSPDLAGLRVGLPREYLPADGLAPAVEAAVRTAADRLAALGADVVEVELPHTRYALPAYYLVATAEASSNLSRFDGVRFGRRVDADELHAMYAETRGQGFGDEVKRRIMLGTFALSAGYQEAWYGKAARVRTLVRGDFEACFEAGVDLLIGPTAPTTAFPLGDRVDDPMSMYLADVFTIPCSLAGLPGLSLPCGFDAAGLPIGLQLIGRPFAEATLLRAAAAYEDATEWRGRRPGGAA